MQDLPPPDERDPPGSLGYLLRRAQLLCLDTYLSLSGGSHPRDMAVLTLLEGFGPVSQQWLADYLMINRSVMVKQIDQQEAAGEIVRRRNPEDRRSYALEITPLGQKHLRAFDGIVEQCDELLGKNLDDAQHKRLKELLRALLMPCLEVEPPAGLGWHTGYLVAHTYFRLSALADRVLRPLGLDTRTFVALAVVGGRGPCSQQELAGWLSIGGAATVELVDELEQFGWVRRERSELDRRSYALQLTPAGSALVTKARAFARAETAGFMSALREGERAELIRLLGLLVGEPTMHAAS